MSEAYSAAVCKFVSLKGLQASLVHDSLHCDTDEGLCAGLSGIASSQYELDCIIVLLTQAAWSAQHYKLVEAVLKNMANRLGYSTLPQYMAYHFQPLSYSWFAVRGLDLSTLLLVKVVYSIQISAHKRAIVNS